jgi:hypothetical protein
MRLVRREFLVITVLASILAAGCASTGTEGKGTVDRDVLTREEIMGVEANNLYDVIRRLRPRWLQVRSTRSFSMETEIAVVQNEMYLGTSESLKQMTPELAYELRYLEGSRAATVLPTLMTGTHIEGAIVILTRPTGD